MAALWVTVACALANTAITQNDWATSDGTRWLAIRPSEADNRQGRAWYIVLEGCMYHVYSGPFQRTREVDQPAILLRLNHRWVGYLDERGQLQWVFDNNYYAFGAYQVLAEYVIDEHPGSAVDRLTLSAVRTFQIDKHASPRERIYDSKLQEHIELGEVLRMVPAKEQPELARRPPPGYSSRRVWEVNRQTRPATPPLGNRPAGLTAAQSPHGLNEEIKHDWFGVCRNLVMDSHWVWSSATIPPRPKLRGHVYLTLQPTSQDVMQGTVWLVRMIDGGPVATAVALRGRYEAKQLIKEDLCEFTLTCERVFFARMREGNLKWEVRNIRPDDYTVPQGIVLQMPLTDGEVSQPVPMFVEAFHWVNEDGSREKRYEDTNLVDALFHGTKESLPHDTPFIARGDTYWFGTGRLLSDDSQLPLLTKNYPPGYVMQTPETFEAEHLHEESMLTVNPPRLAAPLDPSKLNDAMRAYYISRNPQAAIDYLRTAREELGAISTGKQKLLDHYKAQFLLDLGEYQQAADIDQHSMLGLWVRFTAPELRYRWETFQSKRHLTYIHRTARNSGESYNRWQSVLAAGYARIGDFDEAVRHQQSVLELSAEEVNPADFFHHALNLDCATQYLSKRAFEQPLRKWRSANGKHYRLAELAGTEREDVLLRYSPTAGARIPLAQLSRSDRLFVQLQEVLPQLEAELAEASEARAWTRAYRSDEPTFVAKFLRLDRKGKVTFLSMNGTGRFVESLRSLSADDREFVRKMRVIWTDKDGEPLFVGHYLRFDRHPRFVTFDGREQTFSMSDLCRADQDWIQGFHQSRRRR